MIEALISSKTRIKLLLKFFLNSNTSSYLRSLEGEFGESSNGIRVELNRFEKAGMLVSHTKGNKKYFQANTNHPLYSEVNSIIMKHIGFDKIIDHIVNNMGKLDKVYVIGDFARGIDSKIVDLLFVGDINTNYVMDLIQKVEKVIKRKIRYVSFIDESKINWTSYVEEPLLLWTKENMMS